MKQMNLLSVLVSFVKGTTNGSITGVDGTFNVKANPSDVLVISYVGYATVEQQVGNQTQLCNTPARRLESA